MFFSREEVEFSAVEDSTCARERGHVITVISGCGEAVVYQIRASVPFPYCSAITANDAFERTKRVTFPISIFETFRGARGSLNRVPLVYVSRGYGLPPRERHGREWGEMGCGIEQTETEMKDRIRGRRGRKKKWERVFAAFMRAHLRLERYNVLQVGGMVAALWFERGGSREWRKG